MCKSALQNVQPYQKKEIMFIDLVRACGLWLPIRAGREASEKSGKERFKGWSLGTKSPTTNPPLPGSRALRKGSGCLPVRALSLLPELRGLSKVHGEGPRVGTLQSFAWMGLWIIISRLPKFTPCEWEIVLGPRKEGREKS